MKTKILNSVLFSILTLGFVFSQKVNPLLVTVSLSKPTCNGYSNGYISLSPNGGTLPYTYLWSNGETTETISNLSAGNYSVTITDGAGQVVGGVFTVEQPAPITIQAVSTNVTSYGLSNGTVDVLSVENVAGNYIYEWSSTNNLGYNPLTLDQTSLAPNTYKLTITDQNGCQGTRGFLITQPFNVFKPFKSNQYTSKNSIYPNPSNGNVNVEFDSTVTSYRVVSMETGIEILTGTPNGEKLNIDNMSKGNYLMYTQNGGETQIEKIIVL